MGVRGGREFFSSKWVTAEITDEQNRLHIVPIRNEIDGYFIANVNRQNYVFKIDHSRIKIWYATLTKSFRVLHYTTAHYMPVSDQDCKALELMVKENGLPNKIDKMLFHILHQLGMREKEKFEEHDLEKLVAELGKRKDKNATLIRNMKTYLDDLNTKKIITPVKQITEFLYKDLIETDPRWVDSVGAAEVKADIENRKINNEPVGSGRAWRKPLIILGGIAVFAAVGWIIYDSGFIQGLIPDLSNFKGITMPNAAPQQNLMSKYPDPVDLKIACEQGVENCSNLPDNVKKMLETVKIPTSQTIEITP